jgi:hypothetical protein
MNLGSINMTELARLARLSGITESELHRALQERGMLDVAFCTSSL